MEYIDEFITLERLDALIAYWILNPPVSAVLANPKNPLAVIFGADKAKRRKQEVAGNGGDPFAELRAPGSGFAFN